VDGDRAQVLLVDLGGVLFSFGHEYRLTVLERVPRPAARPG